MVSSEDYWKDREADWQIEYAKNQAHWDAKINEIYTDLQNRMADEINAWYMRYADQNGLTMAQAKQAVSRADQDYYAKRAEYLVGLALQDMRSGTDQNARIYFSDVANAEMALYNTTMKISRMQVLQSMLNIQIAQSVGQTNQAMTSALTQHATQVLLDRAKVLGPTVMNNMSRLPALINASFHGATFSDRLWTTHQSNLQKGIQNALARGLILGEHPERFRREIVSESKLKTRAAFRAARTLLNTEFCRVQTSAEMMAYQSEGFKEYMYIANERCCEDCQDLDGNVYKVKDESAGQNLPPMHPNCRCSIAPYSDRDEYEKWLDGYKEHGMTWEEWEAQNHEIEFKAHQEEQEYKTVSLNAEQPETFTTNFREERKAYPIEERKNWYVEEGVHVKPRQVHEINKAVQTAMKAHGLSDLGNTKIIIVNDTTLSTGALAAYDPVQDVLKLGYYLTNETAFELDPNDKSLMPHNLDVTMIHELFHWKDAKEYRKKIGEITQETRREYFEYRNEFAQSKLSKLVEKYDLERISAYSQKSMGAKKFDEVYTELRTFLLQGGQYASILR